nr:hypothetical protein Itr_chr13CG21730 [Ipomoea trifida]
MEDIDGQMGTNFTKALNGFLAAFGWVSRVVAVGITVLHKPINCS